MAIMNHVLSNFNIGYGRFALTRDQQAKIVLERSVLSNDEKSEDTGNTYYR